MALETADSPAPGGPVIRRREDVAHIVADLTRHHILGLLTD
jgi:hypothetical protein